MHQQALGRRLVLAEVPDAPEERQERREATLGSGREAVRPALLGDLRRIALGHRPGARRVHDQRALTRHQPLVVGSVVPRRHVARHGRHQLLVVLERLTDLVVLDHDFTLGVDEDGAVGMEDRPDRVDRVRRRAETNAERVAALVAVLGRLQERVECPGIGLGWCAGRIHRLDVDPGQVLQVVDARARTLDLAADRGRHGEPLAVDLAEIFDRGVDGAVVLDQLIHEVVDRDQLIGIARRQEGVLRENVVTRLRLRFGRGGQQQLVALRGDEVDLDVDLFLVGPFLDQRLGGAVGVGHPMVPEAHGQLARGVSAANEGSGDECRRRRRSSGDKTTTTYFPGHHTISS